VVLLIEEWMGDPCIVEKPLSILAAYSLVKLREFDGYINLDLIKPEPIDETLPITNKPKHPKTLIAIN
jgi:hypothetical protein